MGVFCYLQSVNNGKVLEIDVEKCGWLWVDSCKQCPFSNNPPLLGGSLLPSGCKSLCKPLALELTWALLSGLTKNLSSIQVALCCDVLQYSRGKKEFKSTHWVIRNSHIWTSMGGEAWNMYLSQLLCPVYG